MEKEEYSQVRKTGLLNKGIDIYDDLEEGNYHYTLIGNIKSLMDKSAQVILVDLICYKLLERL